ncbi:hypothetical protein AMJ50_00010 [Parcubacteria bacterium DG_74_3]|nr:MAG: hypothetical protein AMJ50_00010 [Parcubacteria bacterium DG_74_3]
MSKKIIVLVFVVLLLVVGGVFCWQKREIKGSPDDYVIQETPEGTIVENERAGLTVKVPGGWITEKIEIMEGSVVFYTPDIESVRPNKKDSLPLKKGCMIEMAVDYLTRDLEELENIAKEEHKAFVMKSDMFEMIEVDNIPAFKNTFDCTELGSSIEVYIPRKDILYGFRIAMGAENTEGCFQAFDELLKTVSIK